MPVGTIARTHERGFGFIEPFNDPSPAVFFHLRSLIDIRFSECLNRQVRFDVRKTDKGTCQRAIHVWPE